MFSDDPSIESLIEDLRSPSDARRETAAFALADRPDPRAVDALIAVLPTREWGIRHGATQALANIGAAAVSPMLERLPTAGRWVRCDLVCALGDTGDLRAVEPLIEALSDEDSFIRRTAAAGLGKLGDARAVEPLIETLSDERKPVRREAIQALLRIGRPAVKSLDRVAAVSDSPVSRAAAMMARDIRAHSDPRGGGGRSASRPEP